MFTMPLEQRLTHRPFQLVKWMETLHMTHNHTLSHGTIHQYFHPTRPPDAGNDTSIDTDIDETNTYGLYDIGGTVEGS